MAELLAAERLQPCLLDRLTDDEPERRLEGRDRRVFSLRQIRESVLRDLAWLMNTPRRFGPGEPDGAPNIASSVLNFGVPDLCGVAASGVDLRAIERELAAALRRYEPRILPSTLRVRAAATGEGGRTAIVFEVSGELWARPVPEPLYIKTELDLETGRSELEESAPA